MLRIHSFPNNERKQKTKHPVFTQGKQVNNQDSREKKITCLISASVYMLVIFHDDFKVSPNKQWRQAAIRQLLW